MATATTYADIRAAVDAAEAAGLPVPNVDLRWHAADEFATDIVRAFPDLSWVARQSGRTEWVDGRHGMVEVYAFLTDAAVAGQAKVRAAAVIKAAREDATVTPEGTPKPVAVSA
jgi:hypothetical protein